MHNLIHYSPEHVHIDNTSSKRKLQMLSARCENIPEWFIPLHPVVDGFQAVQASKQDLIK